MGVSWLKSGEQSAQLAQQEKAAAEKRASEKGKMFRFYMKPGEDAKITFVDGEIHPSGFLLPPRFYEHMIFHANSWQNFVCPEQTNLESKDKCPLCESGDRPSLVALFTVIDHRQFTGKDNKVYSDTPKLLVAKPKTMELLNKIAAKRGGLAGAQFDVSRATDKDPAVGNLFDFSEKTSIEELKAKYTRKDEKGNSVTYFVPADYETEIVFRTGEDLRLMGFGAPSVTGSSPMGSGTSPAGNQQPAQNYENHL